MPATVRVERVGSSPLAVVRRTVRPSALSKVVPESCGVVWEAVKAAGMKGGHQLAIYRDADDGQIQVESGVEVPSEFAGHGEVVPGAKPAGEAATATHFGGYGGLGATHAAIKQWCKAEGHSLEGTRWEVYGHWLPEWNNGPSKIQTDVFYLLKS